MKRNPILLDRNQSLLVLVDVQQKLIPAIAHYEAIVKEMYTLLRAARILSVPVLGTEQYPKGLGSTIQELKEVIPGGALIEKTTFSCCGEPAFVTALEEKKRNQVILIGIEAHVCMLQTAMDLLAAGYQVHIPAGGTGSRSDCNKDNALQRIESAGGMITNTESVLFEWLVDSKSPEFREIQKLIV